MSRRGVVERALSRVVPLFLGLVIFAGFAAAKPGPDGFADMAEKLLPAVVNISTTQTLKPDKTVKGGPSPSPQMDPDSPQAGPGPESPFEDFFKDFFDQQGRTPTPRHAISLGSGFIIDPSGLIVTNNHVIADADADGITVTLQDNTDYKAEVVGKDTKTDLALLRIKPTKPLAALKFGNSDLTRVGDWVLAIGNPFGLGGTVTAGILSARAREINSGPYDDFLQTDASINRGNSGGPMFNMDGEVIGINTAIYSPSGGSIGIGFAVPADLAAPIIDQLKQFGHARRGWLGVNIQSVNDEIADTLGMDKPRGALIASVQDKGPAQTGGLLPGDVVVTFDGKEVADMHHLPRIVAETPIDKAVKVVVWRKRELKTLEIKVGELKDTEVQTAEADKKAPPPPPEGATQVLGLSVANLTPDLRQRFSIADTTSGVVVTDVKSDSPAVEKGIRAGDVIVEVAQEEVKNPQQITAKIDEARKEGRKSVLLLVDHQGDLRFVALKLDQS